jgi:hypothetical protein
MKKVGTEILIELVVPPQYQVTVTSKKQHEIYEEF